MTSSPAGSVIAVAHDSVNAEKVAALVERSGFSCVATTDLGWAFDEAPNVLLVDPAGWESTVRTLLSRFDIRTQAPPAVLLVCNHKEALYETGPAIDTISIDTDPDKLGFLINTLTALQKNFARSWPRQIEIGGVAEVSSVIDILSERTGIEVRNDRWNLFRTAIKERIVAKLSNSLSEYEKRLSGERGRRELLLLASLIMVGETYFWRYSGQMNALKSLLLERRESSDRNKKVKIWSAGCSTGEEAYSVAMAALEALGEDADVQVIGTDLHPLHLARAQAGVYATRALRNLPQRFCDRWFSAKGTNYTVDENLKARVSFSQLNFVSDEMDEWIRLNGPFDSIFFRNVAIYFDRSTTNKVVDRLIGGLEGGGGLFCGAAETLRPLPAEVNVVHETGAFYYQKSQEEKEALPPPTPSHRRKKQPDKGTFSTYSEGLDLLGREEFKQAGELFEQLLKIDPDCPMGRTGMAILLSNQGREIEARKTLTAVIEGDLAMAETHFMLGLLDERGGLYSSALSNYQKALAADTTFFMAHFNRAWVLKRLGRFDEFASEMKGALAILKSSAKCPVWATGGLGLEAILGLVAEAVRQDSAGGRQ